MQSFSVKVARKLNRLQYRLLMNAAEFSRMGKDSDPAVAALARGIRETIDGRLEPGERKWKEGIEALRDELNRSEEILTIPVLGGEKRENPASTEDRFVGRTVDRTVSVICREAATTRVWSLLFLKTILHLQPGNCLELGTSLGISAACIGAGLEMNGRGRLITLEGAESIAGKARENLAKLGIGRVDVRTGWFNDTLDPALQDLGNVNFAFIDGHHFKQPTLAYFERIYPYCAEGALLVFDDIAYSPEMEDAWRVISADPRISVVVDLFKKGFCFISKHPQQQRKYRLAID
jgi:predicted O-methyltransferase YrrM